MPKCVLLPACLPSMALQAHVLSLQPEVDSNNAASKIHRSGYAAPQKPALSHLLASSTPALPSAPTAMSISTGCC